MDPDCLSLQPSLDAISLLFIPISPQHIILLFSSVGNCFPFPIAMKSSFFFKKSCTGSVCTLGTSGRLSTVSAQLIFHHEKGLHKNCTNLSWEPLKVFCAHDIFVSSALLFGDSGINFPRPLYYAFFIIADPDPVSDPEFWPKIGKKFTAGIFFIYIFWSKIAIYLSLGLKDVHFKIWKFFTFFYCCGSFLPSWIRIRI